VVDAIPQKTALLQSTTDFVLQNLADWYLDKIQLDSAKHYLDRLEKEGNKNVLTSILLSQYYAARQDTTQAIALLENTLKSTTYTHTYQNDILALTLLGIYYFDQGNTTQAQAKLLQAIAIIKNKGDVDMVSSFTAYDRLARIAALQKDYALAYSYQQKSYEILSDIKIKEKRNAVYALQAAVNKSKRDQIIADKEWALALSQYRLQKSYIIIGVVILIIVLGTMVAYLLYRSAQRKQQLKWQQVQQEKELVQLKAIMKGEEQERARIAREIHDGVMVQFAAVKMNLQNIPIQHQQDSVMSYVQSPYFNNIVSQLDRASQELRMTSHHLMPDYLLQSGLVEALYYFCNNITKHQNITLSFQWHGELLPLQQEPMLHIYRIVQELMQNIIKHAQAQKVLVQILSTDDGWLTLTIEDDGVGYQTQNTAAGMGLNNLEKRVQLLNGKLDIKSTIGEGTSVYIELDTLSLQEKNPE
jgi:signal transduction histidine kinase